MDKALLIEIGVEELPAIPLLKELKNISLKWQEVLNSYHLQSEFEFFYTPRRLVIFHKHFKERQDESIVEFIGAPKQIAYKDGKLSPAAQSFLQKAGISEKELSFKEIKGKEVLYHQRKVEGLKSVEVLAKMIEQWLKSLNFGKSMRWGENDFDFIRPIRSLACIFGEDLVEFEIFGVKSAKKTFVHRSVSYDLQAFKTIAEYFKLLEQNYIILDPIKRKEKILNELKTLENKNGVKIADDEELLAEVVAITEYPKALLGSFQSEFLSMPSEVIITSMREHQRYFAVFKDEKLSNHFVLVSNAVCEDYTQITMGNERVLHARLSDAMFFYQNDLKIGLKPEKLENMSYLSGLGTMLDKTKREQFIATCLCEIYTQCDKDELLKAIYYSKADLASQMVYEFSELQGIIGSYYAKKMNLSDDLSLALYEQYLPNSDKAKLPSTTFSSIVALANKLDTLMGLFSIGKIPSGTKDPYALRRAANGVLKIVLNLKQDFDLKSLLEKLSPEYKSFDLKTLLDFIFERLYTFYEANTSFVKAALSSKNTNIIHIDRSIKSLIKVSKNPNFNENFSTFKRLANIAVKNQTNIDEILFTQAEKELYSAFLQSLQSDLDERLEALFALKSYIDRFFDEVIINAEDEKLKNNRQALVYKIYSAFLDIADIKELSV